MAEPPPETWGLFGPSQPENGLPRHSQGAYLARHVQKRTSSRLPQAQGVQERLNTPFSTHQSDCRGLEVRLPCKLGLFREERASSECYHQTERLARALRGCGATNRDREQRKGCICAYGVS